MSTAPTTPASPPTPRPSVIQLAIKEKAALYAAYIPLFSDGGVFIPTSRDYKLGDDVYVLLSLPDDPQRYPVAGKVAWVTPARAAANRTQGVGVRFPADDKSKLLKVKIEDILGGHLASERPTQTI
ncbi:pilus assembly protein PilZ [Caenimonas sedimenti]|jgi:type IV pilus assembly protein PilZ|uniref:Pilus assembly protein PilZ n=1 Tax=Caenimonas sedimenti TaxID=2596921 RepID=A0A562ZHN0_9BURK|nr:PilZ domain-containing protein [Caenimonas sedimenti]TWO68092.1 pilus assembly protein PilZ [Caenimonas sedimenti]